MTAADRAESSLPFRAPLPKPGTPAAMILTAARKLFADKGFSATTTRSIADAAGVNLAMIHYYHGNKEQLYRRVLEQELVAWLRIMLGAVATDAAPRDLLAAIPEFILDLHRQRPELMQLLLRDMADGTPRLPSLVRELGEQGPLALRPMLFGVIEAVQTEGFAAGIPAAHLVAVFFAIGNGLMAFAPMIAEVLGLDMDDPETIAAVGRSAGTIVRRALATDEEA